MAIAQQLYEGVDLDQHEPVGLITYMRTDSPQVSAQSQEEARRLIAERYGPEYLPDEPPVYRAKSRGAQEAHEAVRPTSVAREPKHVAAYLTPDQLKLYTLVWKRFVASQMRPAEYDTMTIEVEGKSDEHQYLLRASASSLRITGFLEVSEDRGNGASGANGAHGDEAGRPRSWRLASGGRARRGADLPRSASRSSISPSRRRAIPRRRWSKRWRNWGSAGRQRTRPRFRRCRPATMSAARRAR
jgi:hypothetical protein